MYYMFFGTKVRDNGTVVYYAEDAVTKQRFKVSTFQHMNDIYECSLRLAGGFEVRELLGKTQEQIRNDYGMLCFGKDNWNSQQMWAYYGASNYGVCLGFEFTADPLAMAKVTYQDEIPEVPRRLQEIASNIVVARGVAQDHGPHAVSDGLVASLESQADTLLTETVKAMMSTKHTTWQSESEWRTPIKLEDCTKEKGNLYHGWLGDNGDGFVLRKVITGAKCPLTKKDVLAWIPSGCHPDLLKCVAKADRYEFDTCLLT